MGAFDNLVYPTKDDQSITEEPLNFQNKILTNVHAVKTGSHTPHLNKSDNFLWPDDFTKRPDFLVPPNSSFYKPLWSFDSLTTPEHAKKQALLNEPIKPIWFPHPSSTRNDPYYQGQKNHKTTSS
jgi:hypothetical protein